jgi:hypothetical protein
LAAKFLDIKCRKTGLSPNCAVLVATIRALKMHGGVKKEDLKTENLKALEAGMANLPATSGIAVQAAMAVSINPSSLTLTPRSRWSGEVKALGVGPDGRPLGRGGKAPPTWRARWSRS